MVFVFVAFAYSLDVNNIRSFRLTICIRLMDSKKAFFLFPSKEIHNAKLGSSEVLTTENNFGNTNQICKESKYLHLST